jgi:hypothetical protein
MTVQQFIVPEKGFPCKVFVQTRDGMKPLRLPAALGVPPLWKAGHNLGKNGRMNAAELQGKHHLDSS